MMEPDMEEIVELFITGEKAVELDMTTLQDVERAFSSQAGASRIFQPQPFVASPSHNALGTPWFLDYAHLACWFFFFCDVCYYDLAGYYRFCHVSKCRIPPTHARDARFQSCPNG